jgi:integrase
MASIKTRPGSPYWICCYRKANGERTQRSTKQENKDKAWEVCLAWADAERKAGQGVLTEAQARRVISEIVERTTGEPLSFYTAEGWLREWMGGKKQTKSEGTSVRYEHVIEGFITHLGKRAALNIAHIAPRDVKTFRDKEIKAGKAPKTCNLAVKVIGGAFNAARRQGLITSNPAEALESLHHKAESKEAFKGEQLADLLASATSEDWRGAMLFAHFTGARLRDVANMKWDCIDLAGKLIRFKPQKTARTEKVILIPMHPQLEAHLLKIAGQDNPRAFLFPSLAGRKTGGAHGLSKTFAGIMERAGIKANVARPRTGVGRAASKLSFHSFRHGFNSAMANAGIAQEIRQLLTGHASAEMNKTYTHVELNPLRDAVKVIPTIQPKVAK